MGRLVSMHSATFIQKVEISLGDIAENTGINWETVHLIITEDLGMTNVNTKGAPKNLTSEETLTRLHICENWLENWDNVDKVISGDESLIFEYELQTKSRAWSGSGLKKSTPKRRACQNRKPKIWLWCSLISAG